MVVSTYVLGQLRQPGLLSILVGGNVVLCLGLSNALIPFWGGIGAACALVLTQVIGAVIVLVFYLRHSRARLQEVLLLCRADLRILADQLSEFLWKQKRGRAEKTLVRSRSCT